MNEKGQTSITVIEIISGILLIMGGLSVIVGRLNLGSLLATVGLLIEILKEILRRGL